jgi:hypothetical protein
MIDKLDWFTCLKPSKRSIVANDRKQWLWGQGEIEVLTTIFGQQFMVLYIKFCMFLNYVGIYSPMVKHYTMAYPSLM